MTRPIDTAKQFTFDTGWDALRRAVERVRRGRTPN
jgi:hypothetical protein